MSLSTYLFFCSQLACFCSVVAKSIGSDIDFVFCKICCLLLKLLWCSFTLFLDYVTANTCRNNVKEHHNSLSSKFCNTQNLATTIDVNCIIIGSHECTVKHKRPTSASGFSLNKLQFLFHQTISYSSKTLGIYDVSHGNIL